MCISWSKISLSHILHFIYCYANTDDYHIKYRGVRKAQNLQYDRSYDYLYIIDIATDT